MSTPGWASTGVGGGGGLSHDLTAACLERRQRQGLAEDPSTWRCGRCRRRLSGVPYRAPLRESSPGGSYGTASRGRPLRPEVFPYEVRRTGQCSTASLTVAPYRNYGQACA